LNIGFRYDLYTQPVGVLNTGAMFDPFTANNNGRLGILQIPGQNGNSGAVVKGHHNNFAPRRGFAYQATRKFVIRGGYGIFFSNREQNDQTSDMALSLYNFSNINMPTVSQQTTVAPPLPLQLSADREPPGRSAVQKLYGDFSVERGRFVVQ
jgi:hypothetical protein